MRRRHHFREVTPTRLLRRESQSTVSEGDVTTGDICKECGHSYPKCICLRCAVCGNLLVQVEIPSFSDIPETSLS